MTYAIQIQQNESAWKPGIHNRYRTKKAATEWCDRINRTGGKARVVRKTKAGEWVPVDAMTR